MFAGRLIILVPVLLTGCALAPVAAQYPVTTASVGVFAATGKGPTDHAISYAAKQDCSTLRILDNEPTCHQYTVAPVVDAFQQPTRMVAANDANSVFAYRAKNGKISH
jgi:hypothetical protein